MTTVIAKVIIIKLPDDNNYCRDKHIVNCFSHLSLHIHIYPSLKTRPGGHGPEPGAGEEASAGTGTHRATCQGGGQDVIADDWGSHGKTVPPNAQPRCPNHPYVPSIVEVE